MVKYDFNVYVLEVVDGKTKELTLDDNQDIMQEKFIEKNGRKFVEVVVRREIKDK
jgi:hypothetical protein